MIDHSLDAGWARAVRDQEEQRYAAILDPDLDRLDRLFDDQLVYTHSSGIVDTKSSYLKAIASGRLRYHRASADIAQLIAVPASDDAVVICISRVRMKVDVEGVPHELVNQCTGLWVRSVDDFKLLAFQATPLSRAE